VDELPLARLVIRTADGIERVTPITGPCDLALIDTLARRRLAARRSGETMVLRDIRPKLWELLNLAGLVGLAGLGREVIGQPEGLEELGGVQEGVDPGHPVL
jgi:hypothetical protein